MPKPKKTVVVIPADTHCGSTVGLIPPGQWQLEDGGYYHPSPTQAVIWQQWEECADLIAKARKGARLVVVHNGDATDGNHHGSTQFVSGKPSEQERIHIECMDWFLKRVGFNERKGDFLYYIGGTESHVGMAWQSEENIARDLGAVMYRPGTNDHDGRAIWPRLRLDVNGCLFDIAHHAEKNRGRLAWTTRNSIQSFLKSVYFSALESGARLPRFWVRAHYHVYTPDTYQGRKGRIDYVLLPAMQAKTHYTYKVAPGDLSTMGVWWAVVEPDGKAESFCEFVEFEESEIVKI